MSKSKLSNKIDQPVKPSATPRYLHQVQISSNGLVSGLSKIITFYSTVAGAALGFDQVPKHS